MDEQGTGLTLPFSNDFWFFTNGWENLGSGQFGLSLSSWYDIENDSMAVTTLGDINRPLLETQESGGDLHVFWRTQKQVNLRIFPRTTLVKHAQARPVETSNNLAIWLKPIDRTLTAALTFPFHFTTGATPIEELIPVRHPNDQRELCELLVDDPQHFGTYLNSHYKKYVHETSYSTAPALFGALFYDLGLKFGGHVFQYNLDTSPELLFDETQFLFVPAPQDPSRPVVLCELNNQDQRSQKAQTCF